MAQCPGYESYAEPSAGRWRHRGECGGSSRSAVGARFNPEYGQTRGDVWCRRTDLSRNPGDWEAGAAVGLAGDGRAGGYTRVRGEVGTGDRGRSQGENPGEHSARYGDDCGGRVICCPVRRANGAVVAGESDSGTGWAGRAGSAICWRVGPVRNPVLWANV